MREAERRGGRWGGARREAGGAAGRRWGGARREAGRRGRQGGGAAGRRRRGGGEEGRRASTPREGGRPRHTAADAQARQGGCGVRCAVAVCAGRGVSRAQCSPHVHIVCVAVARPGRKCACVGGNDWPGVGWARRRPAPRCWPPDLAHMPAAGCSPKPGTAARTCSKRRCRRLDQRSMRRGEGRRRVARVVGGVGVCRMVVIGGGERWSQCCVLLWMLKIWVLNVVGKKI